MSAGSLVDRRRTTLAAEDMEKGLLLAINLPRTAAELDRWIQRRDRYRVAICRWAVRGARADWFGFHAGREAVAMVRRLGLTLADDERISARVPTGPGARRWTKGTKT